MRLFPILLVCPCLTGCLAYGYPSVAHTPAIKVDEPDVKAFRVTNGMERSGACIAGLIRFDFDIKELPIEQGEIAPQQDAYLAYRCLAFPVVSWSYHRSLIVRVYRRGFETRVIESQGVSGLFTASVATLEEPKRAETIEAREKAIDDVAPDRYWSDNPEVSEFVAGEYLALAGSPELAGPDHEETRQRLVKKAETARESAKMSETAPESRHRERSLVQTTAVP